MKKVTVRDAVSDINKSIEEMLLFEQKLDGALKTEFELMGRRIDKRIQKLIYAFFMENNEEAM